MFSAKRQIGNTFEDKALKYLEDQGYELIERNYLTPYGEIDLIMADHKTGEYVFVEVKSSQTSVFGSAVDKINRKKNGKNSQISTCLSKYSREIHYHALRCRLL